MSEYTVRFISPTSTVVNVTADTPDLAVEIASGEVYASLCHECSHERNDADWEATSVDDAEGNEVLNLDPLDAALARIAELESQLARAREIHKPIEALNVRDNRPGRVCSGCGTDDGNWQVYPCPTARALGVR